MLADLKELWRFRELLWAMVERELKIRYKNSALGFLWSLVNPLATVIVMTLVFKVFLRNSTENFSAYVLAAYLPYLCFQLALMDSAQSVLAALPVVKKVYFPREILPLASVISNFIHLLMALLVFFVYLFVVWASTGFGVCPFTWHLLFLPVLLVVYLALTTGMSLLISAYNVFYEDVKYVVGVGLYLLFFLTPIMYFSETVKTSLKASYPQWANLGYFVYHLNPIAMFSVAFRKTLLPPTKLDVGKGVMMQALPFDWGLFGITAATSFGLMIFGYWMFCRIKWRFVERP